MLSANKYIKTVVSHETNLGLSIVYGKPPFSEPEHELGIFISNRDKIQFIIYMTPILIFLSLFLIWVLVIRSLQSMLFSLEYKIKKYLD